MIDSFEGEYDFLSNFAPAVVLLDDLPGCSGLYFKSTEAGYQAAKTIVYEERLPFRIMHPGQAKRAGKRVTLRADWHNVKLDIMRDLCTQKFNQEHYKQLLLATGDQDLVEGNYWNDLFWGVCHGEGCNHLGRILMSIRAQLAP